MVKVYARRHRPRDDAPTVAIASRRDDLAAEAGVIAQAPGATGTPPLTGELHVTDDPVTALVNWAEATTGASAAPAPEGWTAPSASATASS